MVGVAKPAIFPGRGPPRLLWPLPNADHRTTTNHILVAPQPRTLLGRRRREGIGNRCPAVGVRRPGIRRQYLRITGRFLLLRRSLCTYMIDEGERDPCVPPLAW